MHRSRKISSDEESGLKCLSPSSSSIALSAPSFSPLPTVMSQALLKYMPECFGWRGTYMSPSMRVALLQYKYAGVDRSYLYRFVLQPMNTFLIDFVPLSMAPNTMSLIGLMLMVSGYLLTSLYSPSFDKEMPCWVYVYSAFCIFGYQTIDNLDGRQARRTGNSSPLGLIFDHGVDALNCTFAALLLGAVFSIGQLNSPIYVFMFWCVGFVPFVSATWEEYYTGSLTLAELNGPSDGMAICVGWTLLAAYIPGFYQGTFAQAFPNTFAASSSFGGLQTAAFPIIVALIGIVATAAGNIYQVHLVAPLFGPRRPLSTLLPFASLAFFYWTWVLSSPSFFHSHSRVFCFSSGFLFCQLICNLMVRHICDAEYHILRPALVPLIVAWFNCVLGPLLLPALFPIVSPTASIWILFVFNFSMWLHFISHIIWEMTITLGIRCFVIKPVKLASPTPISTAANALAATMLNGNHAVNGASSSPSTPSSATVGAGADQNGTSYQRQHARE